MDEVTEAPVETTDQPQITEGAEPTVETTEPSFTDIDPTETPEGDITPEWLQERHKAMQADYTRKRQADAETAKARTEELEFLDALKSDRETQQAVLEQLQEILAESESDGETEAPAEKNPLEERLAQLEQERMVEKAAALKTQITGHIEQLAKDAQVELDEHDTAEVFKRATAGEQVNKTTTEAAFKAFADREKAKQEKWQKAYLESKQAPSQLPTGTQAQETPDLSDRETRIKQFAARIRGS